MSIIQATIRETKTKGQVNDLRNTGNVPGIVYGGELPNEKISITTRELKNLINKENFLSNVICINLDGKEQKVLTRNISFDTVTDEPIHFDLMRIVKGGKIILEIPVKFINENLCDGLKQGGVINVVRREVEIKSPVTSIPSVLEADLTGLQIGDSIHISSIKLSDDVKPVISDRDFTIATIAPPTVMKVEEGKVDDETEETDSKESATESEKQDDKKDEGKQSEEKKEN